MPEHDASPFYSATKSSLCSKRGKWDLKTLAGCSFGKPHNCLTNGASLFFAAGRIIHQCCVEVHAIQSNEGVITSIPQDHQYIQNQYPVTFDLPPTPYPKIINCHHYLAILPKWWRHLWKPLGKRKARLTSNLIRLAWTWQVCGCWTWQVLGVRRTPTPSHPTLPIKRCIFFWCAWRCYVDIHATSQQRLQCMLRNLC